MSLDIDRLYKSIKRVDKFLKQSPKHPTPETIHHVRTGTRRLESAFDALKLGKRTERLRRQLSGLRKRCGKVRDMDVLTGLTLSVDPDPQDKACLVQLTEYLGARRVRQNEKLRTFAKKHGPRIRRDLDRVSKKLDRLAKSEKRGLTPPETERSSTLADIASKLRFPAKLTKGKLHPYRLQVKELQYVLQLSKMQHQPRIVSTLGNVKDAIGEWYDWEELVAIASELLDDGPQSGLVQQLASISNKKFEHALAVTNKMRAAYIDGKNRKPSRRRASGRTIRFPVSVAHSAMQA